MKILIVYFSKFGNTQRVAETIANSMTSNGAVKCIPASEMSVEDLEDSELIVMGTPTHRMNLPQDFRPVLEQLPKRVLRGRQVAAFDTSYKMSPWLARFTAAKKLSRKLRKLGGRLVLKSETFHVMDREGPLYEGELERASEWASSIFLKV